MSALIAGGALIGLVYFLTRLRARSRTPTAFDPADVDQGQQADGRPPPMQQVHTSSLKGHRFSAKTFDHGPKRVERLPKLTVANGNIAKTSYTAQQDPMVPAIGAMASPVELQSASHLL